MLLSSMAMKPRLVATGGECWAASRTRQSYVIHSSRWKAVKRGTASPIHSMKQTNVVTAAQMRTGTSDGAFHFTPRQKQKTQSSSRSLWVRKKLRLLSAWEVRGDEGLHRRHERLQVHADAMAHG